ncbi:hypothetical protein [Nocardioides sp. SYSU DS0663]|uniref:hypothetical protein n=1 Tax=Nocardioides sp. SYSU DS0663 TaxID=3416445 RepID=UPI003F4B25E0
MTHLFRALWPITDHSAGITQLAAQARHDLPLLLAQAHARTTGPGRFSVAPSAQIPGSGRTTAWVLLYEAPAIKTPARPYHRTATSTGDTAA